MNVIRHPKSRARRVRPLVRALSFATLATVAMSAGAAQVRMTMRDGSTTSGPRWPRKSGSPSAVTSPPPASEKRMTA